MYIFVEKNADGSHDYQIGGALESGWAVVPSNMEIPASFPYVDIEVGNVTRPSIDGGESITRLEVLSMTAREIPEIPEPVYQPSTDDVLNALLGVRE